MSKWQELNFEESSIIETVDAESSEGVYYITNAITKSKELFLTSESFNDEIYSFKFNVIELSWFGLNIGYDT